MVQRYIFYPTVSLVPHCINSFIFVLELVLKLRFSSRWVNYDSEPSNRLESRTFVKTDVSWQSCKQWCPKGKTLVCFYVLTTSQNITIFWPFLWWFKSCHCSKRICFFERLLILYYRNHNDTVSNDITLSFKSNSALLFNVPIVNQCGTHNLPAEEKTLRPGWEGQLTSLPLEQKHMPRPCHKVCAFLFHGNR